MFLRCKPELTCPWVARPVHHFRYRASPRDPGYGLILVGSGIGRRTDVPQSKSSYGSIFFRSSDAGCAREPQRSTRRTTQHCDGTYRLLLFFLGPVDDSPSVGCTGLSPLSSRLAWEQIRKMKSRSNQRSHLFSSISSRLAMTRDVWGYWFGLLEG